MNLSAVELATYQEAYALYVAGYRPSDQTERLGSQPWLPEDPTVKAWEAHHGHDPRLPCYPEYGCAVTAYDFCNLLLAACASAVQACQDCGNDVPSQGHIYCTDCLEDGVLG